MAKNFKIDGSLETTGSLVTQGKEVATQEWVNAQNFGGGGNVDTSNLVYLASTTDRTEQTVSLITRMKDIYFGTMSGVTTGYSDKHLCAKGFMDDMSGTWLLFPDDWAKGSSAYNDTIATTSWVSGQFLGWDQQERYIYDLGLDSWTTGSTTWYECDEVDDDTALQYVRIAPKYMDPPSEDEDTHMFIGVYSNAEYCSGLSPYHGLLINQGILTTNYGFSSIKTQTYNHNSDVYEDLVLKLPTYKATNLEEDGVRRTEIIATREWVQSNVTGGTTKIYASQSGTTEVSILRIYTDSSGYLHIKTS